MIKPRQWGTEQTLGDPFWCLGHNLAVAAYCQAAEERGWWKGAGYNRGSP